MTNETCGHVDDTDSVDPFEVMIRASRPKEVYVASKTMAQRVYLAKEALADAGYQIVPIQRDDEMLQDIPEITQAQYDAISDMLKSCVKSFD